MGDLPLKDKFPLLFGISNRKEATVREMLLGEDGSVDWNFNWRRRLFVWEEALFNDMLALLNGVTVSTRTDSTYRFLANFLSTGLTVPQAKVEVFGQIWKSKTPSKVIVFVWQLILDKIPMRVNLQRRGMMLPIQVAVFYVNSRRKLFAYICTLSFGLVV
jgi:hypothetical protein